MKTHKSLRPPNHTSKIFEHSGADVDFHLIIVVHQITKQLRIDSASVSYRFSEKSPDIPSFNFMHWFKGKQLTHSRRLSVSSLPAVRLHCSLWARLPSVLHLNSMSWGSKVKFACEWYFGWIIFTPWGGNVQLHSCTTGSPTWKTVALSQREAWRMTCVQWTLNFPVCFIGPSSLVTFPFSVTYFSLDSLLLTLCESVHVTENILSDVVITSCNMLDL